MAVYYLETSALLKRYRTEKGSNIVQELVAGRVIADSFVTSYITALELEATAARALKARIISRRTYAAFLGSFAHDLGETIVLHSVSNYTLRLAIDVTRRCFLRSGDAIHLASALLLRQSDTPPTVTVMVTSDKELLAAAEQEGFRTLDPQAAEAAHVIRSLRGL